MSYETYHIPVNFTDAGKLFGVFEIRNAVETVLLCISHPLSVSGASAADAYAENHRHNGDPRPCGRLCTHRHRRRQPYQMA